MGFSLNFTLLNVGLTLLAAIVPTAWYVACVVIGARRKLQRPYALPTVIMLVMSLLILLGYSSPVFRHHFIDGVMDDGDEARLNWSWLVEALASVGLLVLFFMRKVQKQEGRSEWISSRLPETPTLLMAGVTSYLLVVANLCTQRGVGWPWAAYVPPSAWDFSGMMIFPLNQHYIVGDVFLSIALVCAVGYLTEWWQRWLCRTGAKWYQFHLGTLCVAVFVAALLLWANVAHEGWPSKCMGWNLCVGNLAPDILVAFLLLLLCWVGCEWLCVGRPSLKTEESSTKSETAEGRNVEFLSIPGGRLSSTIANRFAWLGAALYGTGFAVALAAVWLKGRMLPEDQQTFSAQSLIALLAGGFTLFAVAGTGSGIKLYRDAVFGTHERPPGSREAGSPFVLMAALASLNAVLCLWIFVVQPYLGSVLFCSWLYHWRRRRQMVSGKWFPVWALVLWVWAVWVIGGSCYAPAGAVFCALPLLLAADGLLLNAICRWRRTYCIAPLSG